LDKVFLKRRYSESRIGAVTINPILQASNFIMLAYLLINEAIPLYIFAPVFIILMILLVTFVGFKFRNIQLSTDEDIKYEKQVKLNQTLYQIMLALDDDNRTPEFYRKLDEIKEIADIKA
jgi:hypothetical protein